MKRRPREDHPRDRVTLQSLPLVASRTASPRPPSLSPFDAGITASAATSGLCSTDESVVELRRGRRT
jgi:hypothetical protein